MAATTEKENLISLCFAYFMKTKKDSYDEDHKNQWFELFQQTLVSNRLTPKVLQKDIQKEYQQYLESDFDYSIVRKKYLYSEKLKPPTHIHNVYVQMKKLFLSRYIDKNKNYRLYTQSSLFTKIVKDESLAKIKTIFASSLGPRSKIDILSPVDFFIVDFNKKNEIQTLFNDTFKKGKPSKIRTDYLNNTDKTYHAIMLNLFESKELIPISHKMPTGRATTSSLKITGEISKSIFEDKETKQDVDPYINLLNIIRTGEKQGKKINASEMIDELIDIQFNDWDIRESKDSATWKLFVKFNYKKFDPQIDDVQFGLEPLPGGGSGSWNGKFTINKKPTGPWAAGSAPATVHPILSKYNGYKTIMKTLAKKRAKCFDEMISSNKKLSSLLKIPEFKKVYSNHISYLYKNKDLLKSYNDVMKVLLQEKIISVSDTKKNIEKFLGEFINHLYSDIRLPEYAQIYKNKNFPTLDEKDIEEELDQNYINYLINVIKDIRISSGYSSSINSNDKLKIIQNHYISLQMAYIFLAEGREFKLWLKKQIFFTLFGIIAKRSIVGIDEKGNLKDFLTKNFLVKRNPKTISFKTPIHIILS